MRKHLFNLCVIVALFLVCFCSFSQPQKTIVLNQLAWQGGFQLAQENPKLAKAILTYSEHILEIGLENFTEPDFHKWAEVVLKKLKLEPRPEKIFKDILKLVNVEVIKLSGSSKEIVELVYNVIENFAIGIKANK